jgi:hypothetical protein
MHHGIFLGCHRLGVGLQKAAAAQETDGHRGAVGKVVMPTLRKQFHLIDDQLGPILTGA